MVKPFLAWKPGVVSLGEKQYMRCYRCGTTGLAASWEHCNSGLIPGPAQQRFHSWGFSQDRVSDLIPGLGIPYAMWWPKKRKEKNSNTWVSQLVNQGHSSTVWGPSTAEVPLGIPLGMTLNSLEASQNLDREGKAKRKLEFLSPSHLLDFHFLAENMLLP